ncbi:MAG TPA: hypothetical protein VLJ84_09670, partial [Usitatibacter sp.]|nr:hypothetical protein [Usitatibacter sp.]
AAQQDAGGYYPSMPTREGQRMGLTGPFVGSGAVKPDSAIEVIARNEFGAASAWLRGYGAGPGTGLLQLHAPRAETTDIAPLQAVMEFGISW